MIKTEIIKIGKRSLIYTTTDDPENYQIQDEDGNIYSEAYDVNLKTYTEVERVDEYDEKDAEKEETTE